MLTISPELQKQIEYNARYEGVAPDQWLETAVSQRAAFLAAKRLWEAEEKADIRADFIENGKHYTDADIIQELEHRRALYLQKTGGVYIIVPDTGVDDITPEELEELKEDFRIAEENFEQGNYYTTEEVHEYVNQKLAEFLQAPKGNA